MARVKINPKLIIKTKPVFRKENIFGIEPPKSILIKQMPSFGVENCLVIIGSSIILFSLVKFVSWLE